MRDALVLCADVLEGLASLPDDSLDGCLCDPPYGLRFMGKTWDHGVPSASVWREVLRVLKPGAHLLAFGGTRTHHRLTCAIEDAGFEIRDCLMWLHGQGFPKSLDVSKAIDDAAGAERRISGQRVYAGRHVQNSSDDALAPPIGTFVRTQDRRDISEPATDAARVFSGYGTALKPAWEPIILAMKPCDGTFAENAVEHGVAGLNVDGCRIAANGDKLNGGRISSRADGWDRPWKSAPEAVAAAHERGKDNVARAESLGRWPANVLLSHLPECSEVGTRRVRSGVAVRYRSGGKNIHSTVAKPPMADLTYAAADGREEVAAWECAPGCPVAMLDEQSGERRSAYPFAPEAAARYAGTPVPTGAIGFGVNRAGLSYTDNGGASRFFYCAKADSAERSAGVAGRNMHPTVKPVDLCRYLALLILPPRRTGPGRRLLVPFSGSGSEMIGALRAGWDKVVGIDSGATYCATAMARVTADAPLLRGAPGR